MIYVFYQVKNNGREQDIYGFRAPSEIKDRPPGGRFIW
jgi:hypothetical protein